MLLVNLLSRTVGRGEATRTNCLAGTARGATYQKALDGDARKKETGRAHAWGTPGHCGRVQVLEKLEIVSYYVSRAGPSRSRLKAPKRPNARYARAVEGTIHPCER